MAWYPPDVTVAPTGDAITVDDAALHCRVDADDAESMALLAIYLAAATAHVEQYISTPLTSRTVTIAADSFADMARLPIAPVSSITFIEYVDSDGATQTVAGSVYRLIASGIEALIELKYGQSWPTQRSGERITVTAVVGYDALPFDIKAAILLLTGNWFRNRESAVVGETVSSLPDGVAALLCNHRRLLG